MAAHENLSEYQFRYRPVGGPFKPEQDHEVQAIHKPTGERIGAMSWLDFGPVHDIHVRQEHRRKGVATGMWNHAIKIAESAHGKGVNKRISMVEHSIFRTPEGDAWAKSTGDSVPPNTWTPMEDSER